MKSNFGVTPNYVASDLLYFLRDADIVRALVGKASKIDQHKSRSGTENSARNQGVPY